MGFPALSKPRFPGPRRENAPRQPAPDGGGAPQPGPGRFCIGFTDTPGDEERPILVPLEQLSRHVFLAGKTGTGKTVTLTNWCLRLAGLLARRPDAAPGFTYIDPHGDAVTDLLARLPEEIADRVHVLHFRDTDRPRGFNLLEAPEGLKEACIGSFVAMLRDLFPSGTGHRMEHILKNALLTLAAAPNQTILSLVPLLSSERTRRSLLEKVSDPVLREFWERQFPDLAKRGGEALGPIYNKLGAFAVYPRVRRVVGQPRSTIDPLKILNEGHILLVDLAGAGEDVAPLVGAALVNRYHFSALSRYGQPREGRRPHFLIADEVHNYATPVMADILSEDRKFGLGFILATQYLDRIPDAVLHGILGNVGMLVVLGIQHVDARRLAPYFGGIMPEDLIERPTFHAAVHVAGGSFGGVASFTMQNPVPPPAVPGRREKMLARSDVQDGVDAARVDAYIGRIYE